MTRPLYLIFIGALFILLFGVIHWNDSKLASQRLIEPRINAPSSRCRGSQRHAKERGFRVDCIVSDFI